MLAKNLRNNVNRSKEQKKQLIDSLFQIYKHKCYYRSLFLYKVCRLFDYKSNYRINIMMHCIRDNAWGHAWLTRNGKSFPIRNRNVRPFILEKIGENNRYIFWITT